MLTATHVWWFIGIFSLVLESTVSKYSGTPENRPLLPSGNRTLEILDRSCSSVGAGLN